jgi:stearoyl-CoA desaturase (delta-9 desaturase)
MSMPLTQRVGNLVGLVLPFAGVVAAVILLWHQLVGSWELAILAVMYMVSALGTTVGFHRLLTHRSFQTHKATEYLFAILGSLSVQGSVIKWVASHRKHHARADQDGDPHTPYGFGSGLMASVRGLWHAHVGWLLARGHRVDARIYAKDLIEDRGMVAISRAFPAIVAAGLVLPAAAGYLVGGWKGAITGLLWGGLVRIFLFHHASFSVNSICHFFGSRRYDTADHSTNVVWLALPSMGEAWHNNHHAFPRSARHGLRPWEIDPSALVIWVMRRLGLAWNVVEIPLKRQLEKEIPRAQPARAGAR